MRDWAWNGQIIIIIYLYRIKLFAFNFEIRLLMCFNTLPINTEFNQVSVRIVDRIG